ncbi:MAG: hypothetical protein H7Z41_00575 [Cytophagales bacterium]|nr:hypothetical protein [Armatimonadota bacterium]
MRTTRTALVLTELIALGLVCPLVPGAAAAAAPGQASPPVPETALNYLAYPTLIGAEAEPETGSGSAASSQTASAPKIRTVFIGLRPQTTDGTGPDTAVFAFRLPPPRPGQRMAEASLWITLADRQGRGPSPGADLHAVGIGSSPVIPTALPMEAPVLLQKGFLGPETPNGRIATSRACGRAIVAYLQAAAAPAEATAPRYLYVRLSAAATDGAGSPSGLSYRVHSGADEANRPVLRLSFEARSPGVPRPPLPGTAWQVPLGPQAARPSDSLIESMGVAVHINPSYLSREDYETRVRPALLGLGIRYIRDGGTDPEFFRRLDDLTKHGIRSTLVITPLQGKSLAELLSLVVAPTLGSVVAIEPTNEPDNEWPRFKRTYKGLGWPAGASLFANEMYDAIHASPNPRIRSLQVLTPPLAHPDRNARVLGPVRADAISLHPYAGGALPDDQMETKWLPSVRAVYGAEKPVVVSETGYHYSPTRAGQPGISERAAARYHLRTYLDFYNRGITRTHVYNLSLDPWGMLSDDGRPRDSYWAIKNLITILSDRGGAFSPRPLSFGLSGDTTGVRYTLLQKRSGRHYLLLWQNTFSYDTLTRQDLRTPTQTVTVTLAAPAGGARLYQPLTTDLPLREYPAETTTFTLAVPDHPLLLEIGR